MGISNYTPSSRISQSGVCTSTTRPASPYEGQVIYETDTNRVLVWNNSAWVAPNSTTANPPALEFIKSQTVGSAVSSVTVSDVFSADYDNYKVTYTGGTCSTDVFIRLQIGNASSGYYGSYVATAYATNTLDSTQVNNGSLFPNFAIGLTVGAYMNGDIFQPFATTPTYVSSNVATTGRAGNFTGYLNNSTSYTSFTISPGSGTISGGTIRVYGYRN